MPDLMTPPPLLVTTFAPLRFSAACASIALVCGCEFGCSPAGWNKPVASTELEVRFENPRARVTLAGTLTMPKGPGPFPAVVLVAGSGPLNRDEEVFGHRPFAVLAKDLTHRGLAVLRYDKRGVARSTGDFWQATTLDFIDDAAAAWDFLASRPDIDVARIGALGHSEGGMIVPTLAVKRPAIAFIVMLAGVGMSGGELESLQNSLLNQAAGMSDAELAYEQETIRLWINLVEDGADGDRIEKALRSRVEVATKGDPAKLEKQVDAFHSPWWRFILTHSAVPDLKHVQCPVMALNGSKDLQVPPKENLVPIARALAAAGNTDFVIREMPGLNHLFQHAATGSEAEYEMIAETISPEVLAVVGDWIVQHVRPVR